MRALHFAALVPERTASPVLAQAHAALQPFVAYLDAALGAARARQVRHRARWRLVPELHRIRLRPLDTLLEPRPGPMRYRVEGWPAETLPPAAQPLMVINRSRLVTFWRNPDSSSVCA